MSYYRTCDYCGAALDPGERCDCKKEKAARPVAAETNGKAKISINIIPQGLKKARENFGGK